MSRPFAKTYEDAERHFSQQILQKNVLRSSSLVVGSFRNWKVIDDCRIFDRPKAADHLEFCTCEDVLMDRSEWNI